MSDPGAAAAGDLRVLTLAHCPVCSGERLEPLGFFYRYAGQDFPAVECGGCGIRFLGRRPDDESLERLYAAGYFEADYRCGHAAGDYFASEEAFRAEDRGLLDAFQLWSAVGTLLEVGCAGGWLLKHARERGWKVVGVEVSREAVERARALGLDVRQGDLARAGLPGESFDLVYMGDVLEHVPDCKRTLLEAARVLRPGGVLYLRGPITTNSLARRVALAACGIAGRSLKLEQLPYHLWEFTPGSLRMLLAATGFEVAELEQTKVPPMLRRPGKSALQRLALFALDGLNWPLTWVFNALGDRATVVARRTGVVTSVGEQVHAHPPGFLQLNAAEQRVRTGSHQA